MTLIDVLLMIAVTQLGVNFAFLIALIAIYQKI